MKKFLTAFLISVLCGCSSDDSSAPAPDSSPENGQMSSSYSINGRDPTSYYEQFIYKQSTKTDKGITYPVYSYLRSETFTLEGETKADDRKCAFFKLAMFKDRTFKLKYFEEFCIQSSERPETWDPVYEDLVSGQWSIDKMDLILGDFARATGLRYNEEEALTIKNPVSLNRKIPDGKFMIATYQKESFFDYTKP